MFPIESTFCLFQKPSHWSQIVAHTPFCALNFVNQPDIVKLPCVNVSDAATFEVWLNPAKSTPLGYIIFKKSTFAIALQDLEVIIVVV